MRREIKVMTGLTLVGAVMSISSVYADNLEGIVNTNVLNIRSGPSTNYNIVTQVKSGNRLQILENSNGWYKVKLSNGLIGYGSNQYINKNNSNFNDTVNMEGKKGQVKVRSSLNIRQGPSRSNSVVGRLRDNDIVNLLEKSNGWYKIKLSNGIVGWVSVDYVSIYTESISNGNSNINKLSNTSKAQAIVNVAYKQLGKPYV